MTTHSLYLAHEIGQILSEMWVRIQIQMRLEALVSNDASTNPVTNTPTLLVRVQVPRDNFRVSDDQLTITLEVILYYLFYEGETLPRKRSKKLHP